MQKNEEIFKHFEDFLEGKDVDPLKAFEDLPMGSRNRSSKRRVWKWTEHQFVKTKQKVMQLIG